MKSYKHKCFLQKGKNKQPDLFEKVRIPSRYNIAATPPLLFVGHLYFRN